MEADWRSVVAMTAVLLYIRKTARVQNEVLSTVQQVESSKRIFGDGVLEVKRRIWSDGEENAKLD